MQTLSSYLLESEALDEQQLHSRFEAVCEVINSWLTDKGATDPTQSSGEFRSLTNDGDGRFNREKVSTSLGLLEQIRLVERTRSGQTFTTRLATTAFNGKLSIYCSLAVENISSVVAPLPNDPRCPAIVRTLLGHSLDWRLNGTPLGSSVPQVLYGDLNGQRLADEIRQVGRAIPIVVVAEVEGETLWPRLAENLAYDLAALAHVVRVDDDATWALTDKLGKSQSCYLGAVRLYWPAQKGANGEPYFNSTVWTASALLSNDSDGKGLNRFRATLRRLVMSTSSLSITPPRSIREIHEAVSRQRLEDLKSRLVADSEEVKIAHLYITENQNLKAQIEQLEAELGRTAARAEAAEHALSQLKAPDVTDDEQTSSAEERSAPNSGDIRFYKKIHSKGAYDILVEVDDCGHTSWQSSNKADKARKGLERLTGRNDWKSLQHCGSCTGGGMWKVRW